MTKDIRLLRTLLWLQLALALAGWGASIALGDRLPIALQEFNQQLNDQYTVADGIVGAVCTLTWLVSFVGLMLLRPWAKLVYVASSAGIALVTFFGPPAVAAPGAASALYDLGAMAAGATVFMLYFTEFGRSWKSVRA